MSCARPGGVVQASSLIAVTVGRSTSTCPAMRSSAGRTNISNDAKELTGLPGSVKIGVPPGSRPRPCGLPGWTATRTNSTPGSSASAALTTSYAPMLTPPDVTTRSTSSSPTSRACSACGSSPTGPIRDGHAAGLADRGREQPRVRVGQLAAQQRRARRDQLVAGGDHRDAGSAVHEHGRAPEGGDRGDVRRPERGAGGDDEVTGHGVLAGPADVRARLPGTTWTMTVAVPPSVCSTGTIASAPWGTARRS